MRSIGVRDHFRWGGGGGAGHNIFARISILARKSNMCWAMHFCRTWGGGGLFGGGEYYSFEVIVYRKPRRGRCGSPSHGGDSVGFWGTKTSVY